ncbi:zinc finger, CCHC-type containing protein, partial [Tanacetum coccineum]
MFTQHEGQRKPFRERGRFNQSRGREQDKNNYKREEGASFEEDTRDKSQVTWYRCHKLGHYAYDCPNKRKNQVREQSNLIEEDLKPALLMATITEKEMIQREYSRECRNRRECRNSKEYRNRRECRDHRENKRWQGIRKLGTNKAVKDNIMASEYKDMMERCIVCGTSFVKFQLCREWIAKSILKMLRDGIDTWAPKLFVKKLVVYFLSPKEMRMGHLQSTFIGETLARMLEYSGVVVRRKRIHDGDHLDIEGKSSYDLYISETLDLLRGSGLTIVSEGNET